MDSSRSRWHSSRRLARGLDIFFASLAGPEGLEPTISGYLPKSGGRCHIQARLRAQLKEMDWPQEIKVFPSCAIDYGICSQCSLKEPVRSRCALSTMMGPTPFTSLKGLFRRLVLPLFDLAISALAISSKTLYGVSNCSSSSSARIGLMLGSPDRRKICCS